MDHSKLVCALFAILFVGCAEEPDVAQVGDETQSSRQEQGSVPEDDLWTAAKLACAEADWSRTSDPHDALSKSSSQVAARGSTLSGDQVFEAAADYCDDLLEPGGYEIEEPREAPAQQDDADAWRASLTNCSVDSHGFAHVEGEIANDSSRMRSYQVSVVLDGSNGLRAGSGTTSASGVPAGSVRTFSFRTSVSSASGGISDCRIESVRPG